MTAEEREERDELGELLTLFLKNDPAWEERRDAAIQGDAHMAELLVQNLVKWMVETSRNAHHKGIPFGSWTPFMRCQNELVQLREHSVPVLLALHTVVYGRDQVDLVVAQPVQQTLARIGDDALPQVIASYEDAGERAERDALLKIIAESGVPAAFRFLDGLRQSSDWQVRARALEGIANLGAREDVAKGLKQRCWQALVRALNEEDDSFVRTRAIKGLGERGGVDSVRVLLQHYRSYSLQSSAAQGRPPQERGELLAALRKATSLYRASQVAEFEAWLEQAGAGNGS